MNAPASLRDPFDRQLIPLLLAALLFCIALVSNSVVAASATASSVEPARNLVTEKVDSTRSARLSDSRSAWFLQALDVGAAPDDLALRGLSVVLNRTPEREQALQQRLLQLQDPGATQYHQWLSPTDFGKQFGSSDDDIEVVKNWLSVAGLHVNGISNNRSQIFFSGSAAIVEKAFATPLHFFRGDDGMRIGNTLDPQIPQALLPAVHTIRGLHAWQHRSMTHAVRGSSTASASSRRPLDTYCPSGGACEYTVFPTDFAKIYDLDAANVSSLTGSGQTIAIVGRARVDNSDLTNYQSISSLTFASPTVIVPPDGVDPGNPATTCSTSNPDTCDSPPDSVLDQLEATLDVERAASIAPQANILLIVSSDVHSSNGTLLADGSDIATNYAIDTDPVPAKILSISFGSCEADAGEGGTEEEAQLFEQAAAEGISVFVASGDAGAAGCEGGPKSTPSANQTLGVNDLCASGFVTCVGGTEFADTSNPTLYWASSDGANFLSALGYIPEGAWNDPLDSNGKPQYAASGGGVSIYEPTPSWQTGPGVPGTQGRYVPDVSFAASNREPYFSCVAAAGGSCVIDSNNEFNFIGGGGTSASTPSMAAITALLDEQTGSAQGNLNPRLYALAMNASNGVFHDITIASSGISDCTVTVPSLCNNSTPGPNGLNGGLAGYTVGNGYDEVTGLGSIDVGKLLANWNVSQSSGVDLDQFGITGSWFDPATNGQGFEINVIPDLNGPGQGFFFAGWFTYDVTAPGGRRWYGVSGNITNSNPVASLQIADVEGGNFASPPIVGAHGVLGQATFSMSDCNTASFTYQFTDGSGRTGTIPLTRIAPNITCALSGDNGAASSDYLLSGSWYDPTTSGQGFLIDINPNINLFAAAWYTFVRNGEAIGGPASQDWFTLQNDSFINGNSSLSNIAIVEASGGVFNNSTPVTRTQVGTANIVFHSCTSMTLTYAFTAGSNTGLSGSIALQRIGDPPAGCSL